MSDGPAWKPPEQGDGSWGSGPPPGQGAGPWPPPGQGAGPWPPPGPGQGWRPPNPPEYGAPGYGGPGQGGYGSPSQGGYGAPWPPPAPKPGVIPLRPIGLGEIIDGSITTIRRNPKATLGFTAVVMAVSTAITTVLSAAELPSLQRISQRVSAGQQLTGADVRPLVGWLVTYGVVNLLLGLAVSVILTGTLTAVVGRAVLGQQVTVSQAWQQARGRIGALAGLTLLILAIFVGMWAVLIGVPVLGFLVSGPVGGVLAIPAIIGGIPLTIFVWVKMSLAPSVVVLERVGPWAAIGRSWRLTRKSFWRVFGIWIVAYLVILLAGLVLQVPFRIVAELVTGTSGLGFGTPPASLSGGTLIAYLVIGAVGGLVAATVTRPIVAGVAALLYVDLRMRREGLDMALQTAAGRHLATGDEFASVWQTPRPGSWQEPGSWAAPQPGPVPPGQGGSGPGAPPRQGMPPW